MHRALGDFQTPPELVRAVLNQLGPVGDRWTRVLEPTCGTGTFIGELLRRPNPPREIVGIEIQETHLEEARRRTASESGQAGTRISLLRGDIFRLHLGRDIPWTVDGPLLVVGNPPWVTSAEQGALGAANLPAKANIKGLPGLEALTGSANFDIAESIWLKLITELADQQPTIALLCKTSVARNVLQYCHDFQIPIGGASIHRVDSRRWFGVSVDACLFTVHPPRPDRPEPARSYVARVFRDLQGGAPGAPEGIGEPETTIGVAGGSLVADLDGYRKVAFADGPSPVTWRQGVKHDAGPVLELRPSAEGWVNKKGEAVDVEPDYCYPLLKGADLAHGRLVPRRALLLPQKALDEDTGRLASEAPRFWSYLRRHADIFRRRRSSIYRSKPEFAVFGVGPYTFAPYKVAVSGLYKTVRFNPVGPWEGRPVVFDDTCYFVPCRSPREAALIWALLTDPITERLLASLIFTDAKRPVTKRLLQRLNLTAVLRRAHRPGLEERYREGLSRLGAAPEALPEDPLALPETWAPPVRAARQLALF